ncbi:chemotaxis protein CheB [Aliterella atlantica]|uniref:chemotaxis protein CheB n=1 Tax=Aliterella atlantica TaxID=1827278 RepID=UPI00069724BA|nr:chemotaxis protein CheB [Aliterella atlantica]
MNPRRAAKKSQPNPSDGEAPSHQRQEKDPLFPVVGIGASAGGLEAFTQLLTYLPANTGMAFAIVQHMPANQESVLSLILARTTRMPVQEVKDGMAIAPNQVYVIPPNASMTIEQGVLKLTPRTSSSRVFMSVDTFLLSLAEERGKKAIGVILSGGDSDGARGIEAIKAAGGVTFAQSEGSAQVNSMPNTAIATGQVDFILPPDQIAAKLAEIGNHPYLANSSATETEVMPTSSESQDALSIIFDLLRKATGVDFTYYKQTTLNRRIGRRMLLYKLENVKDYARYLQNNPTEVMALYEDALIHVTSFFRDPESFEALKTLVFPAIVKDKSPQTPIRIWVAGCSTGEEAYSIAICLLEFLADRLPRLPIQIYATDISETAIEHARNGIYTLSQVANVSSERLYRFFVQVEDNYQISKHVRELCVFARQNLIGDPPFSRLDLISCRNVLIYLGTPLQQKLLPVFHYGLKSTGFLMLGTSETIGDFADLFTLYDKKNKIYAKQITSTRLNVDIIPSSYSPAIVKPPTLATEQIPSDLEIQKEADKIVLNQYAPAGIVIDINLDIIQFRGQTSSYLEPAPGKASLNLLRMAKEELRRELQTAIYQARQQKLPLKREGIQVREGDRTRQITINVIPLQTATQECYLVLFTEMPLPVLPAASDDSSTPSKRKTRDAQEITRLQQELATTREHLQSIIEEQQATNQDLRAANEEILSSNEELQSTNEELETAKEEIQAANEELNTVNEELRRRTLEATQVSNDLQNLLSSINIPILMLGGDLQIRQFTPAVEGIFNLISTDIGRPLSDITHKLNVPNLEQQILEVIRTLNLKAQEIQDRDGHWYDLRIRPYRTIDNKIDGAVLVLVDIDDLKRSNPQLNSPSEPKD